VAVLEPVLIVSGLAGENVTVPVEVLASVTVRAASVVFGLPLASCRCTVIVLEATPAVVVTAVEVITSFVAAPAVNVTVAVCVIGNESVESVAVKTSAAAVVDLTVNVTTPNALLAPEAALMVGEPEPEVLASVTVLPETGFILASFSVTVTVEVVTPSAVTEAGEAVTVDCAAVTALGLTVRLELATPVSPVMVGVIVVVWASTSVVATLVAWPLTNVTVVV
jgi:hypothetical protein